MFRLIKNRCNGIAVAFMVLLGAVPVNAMESFFGKKISDEDKKNFTNRRLRPALLIKNTNYNFC